MVLFRPIKSVESVWCWQWQWRIARRVSMIVDWSGISVDGCGDLLQLGHPDVSLAESSPQTIHHVLHTLILLWFIAIIWWPVNKNWQSVRFETNLVLLDSNLQLGVIRWHTNYILFYFKKKTLQGRNE